MARYKFIAVETTCNTTANTFANNKCIRLFNSDTSSHLVTRAFGNATVIGTATIGPSQEMFVMKSSSDLLSSNAATGVVFATPMGFEN